MIPAEFIDGLLSTTNIAEVVSDYTPLTPYGTQLRGECPFCHNKKPLFTVSTEKRLFKCFSCNKGGNVVRFIMDIKKTTLSKSHPVAGRKSEYGNACRALTRCELGNYAYYLKI